MIPKFSGPVSVTTPHARFLYTEYAEPSEAWKNLLKTQVAIDEIIESHPRLEKAHEDCHLVFFDGSSKTWVGREIIGHMSSWPSPFQAFDSYKGEAFEWSIEDSNLAPQVEDLLTWKAQLASLAPAALAPTWRLRLSPMECLDTESDNAVGFLPNISFQFFKSH
jgi:hypothetical protein